jgi:hypothetical protein
MVMRDMWDSSTVLEENNPSDELIMAQYARYQSIHLWKQVPPTYKQRTRPNFLAGPTTQLLHIPSLRSLVLARSYCRPRHNLQSNYESPPESRN